VSALLEVRGLTKRYGALLALDGLDLDALEGKLTALIGPNGAGKSTAFGCISGAIAPSGGSVRFAGRTLGGMPYHRVARLGLARTYQVVQTFADMTVLEAVMVGAFLHHRTRSAAERAAQEVLRRVRLAPRASVPGAALTIAEKKRLELARALATEPRLILLDEVMAGLTPTEARDAVALLRSLLADGLTIVMVEHVMEVIMPLADHVVVISAGRTIFSGSAPDAVRDERVIEAYLGTA
jgi:branched-chain amino acid transport system ATP-binding protein